MHDALQNVFVAASTMGGVLARYPKSTANVERCGALEKLRAAVDSLDSVQETFVTWTWSAITKVLRAVSYLEKGKDQEAFALLGQVCWDKKDSDENWRHRVRTIWESRPCY